MINATQLPPLSGQHPEGIEEEPDQMMQEMEMDPEAYQQMEQMEEAPEDDDASYDYAMLDRLIENEEDKGTD